MEGRARKLCTRAAGGRWIAVACALALLGGAAQAAQTYQVGPSRPYHSLSNLPALNPGDIVEIDPATYTEVKRWVNPGTAASPIIVRGVGPVRPVFDAAGLNVTGVLPNPRAVFEIAAHYITLENLEFKNARNGDNGAGIRVTSGNNVTVRNCKITQCDMGIMSDNNAGLLIEASEIASNGTSLYDGYSHNFYLGGTNATVQFCYIHDALYGQNFKSRGHYTELLYNYIADSQDGEVGLVDAAQTAPTNSHAVMIGNVIISKPRLSGYNSGRFIQFGQDSGGQHNGTLFAFNNTFIAGDARIQFLSANAGGATIVANNNIFYGSDKIVGTLGGGISGSANWMASTATVPGTFSATRLGSDPGFVNRAGRDFHLTAGSGCRNQGLNALNYLDGAGNSHSGLPTLQYVNHLLHSPRPSDGQIDLGAYEFSAGSSSVPAISPAGVNVVLSWPATLTNYTLQAAGSLPPPSWTPVTNIPVQVGGNYAVTSRITGTNMFFRLNSGNQL